MNSSTLAIEATGLVKSFAETTAVDGVDLAVRAGSVYGVLEGNAQAGDVLIVLATAAALTAVFGPLTNRLYRTRSS